MIHGNMKNSLLILGMLFLMLSACDDTSEDIIPTSFQEIKLNPDEIYLYGGVSTYGVRIDALINDSIKVDVSVLYSAPANGTISFITNEGWYYKPNKDFFGVDNFTYTVCYQNNCNTAAVKMHVEQPLDPNNCTYQVIGESVETKKDQPVEIRIFLNDTVCPPYMGNSISKPDLGTFNGYSYSGTIKNIVYVYYPPKGYVGTDRFKYKIFTPNGDMEAYCTITIKE
jgi:hypothetical protein